MEQIMRISAKKLGELAMPDFCPRCFWIRMHMKGEPPFAIFPQIFGHIDRYTKKLVHAYFDEHDAPPPWLEDLGDLVGYHDPPNAASFQMSIGENILLTGEADAIFRCRDDSLFIGDYKTAFAKVDDDPLYPIYKVQLNAYALLASHCKLGTASGLALIYTQPCTGEESAKLDVNRRTNGFALGFRAEILRVPLDAQLVHKHAAHAWDVFSALVCPKGTAGCRNCRQMEELKAICSLVLGDYRKIA